jgi:hypothetical protein
MKRLIVVLMMIVAAVLIASCATTEVTSVWKDESYQGRPHKVLIQAVLKNPVNRRIVEDEFVRRFRSSGIEAVSAYNVLPGDELATKEALEQQLKAGGFDTLLLMRLTGTREEQHIVPATVTHEPVNPVNPQFANGPGYYGGGYTAVSPQFGGGWPGYYGYGYTAVYSPAYTVEDRYAIAETSLYDTHTEKLIWTATSETLISGGSQKLIMAYVSVMMNSLRKNKLIP